MLSMDFDIALRKTRLRQLRKIPVLEKGKRKEFMKMAS